MREVLPPFTALVDCPAGHLSALSDAVESLLAQFDAHCPPPSAAPDHESPR